MHSGTAFDASLLDCEHFCDIIGTDFVWDCDVEMSALHIAPTELVRKLSCTIGNIILEQHAEEVYDKDASQPSSLQPAFSGRVEDRVFDSLIAESSAWDPARLRAATESDAESFRGPQGRLGSHSEARRALSSRRFDPRR